MLPPLQHVHNEFSMFVCITLHTCSCSPDPKVKDGQMETKMKDPRSWCGVLDWTPCQHFVWSTTFKSVTRTVQVGRLSFFLVCFAYRDNKSERVTRSNAPDVGYCNLVLFSSKADSGIGPEKQMFYQAVACTHSLRGTWLLRWSPIP